MSNDYFKFKQFTIYQKNAAMKVGTDSVLLGAWAKADNFKNIRALDVGTGSGILSIMLAQRFENLQIDGVEVDEQAFEQAQKNTQLCPWADRINLYNESFQTFAGKHTDRYDLVIANPPYFIQSLKAPDEKRTMARHSNTLSQENLINGALKVMKANGRLSVILPLKEGLSFIKKAEEVGLYCNRKMSVRANPQKEVKRLLMEFSKTQTSIEETELCIDSGIRHAYTPEYIELTKDFYLNF